MTVLLGGSRQRVWLRPPCAPPPLLGLCQPRPVCLCQVSAQVCGSCREAAAVGWGAGWSSGAGQAGPEPQSRATEQVRSTGLLGRGRGQGPQTQHPKEVRDLHPKSGGEWGLGESLPLETRVPPPFVSQGSGTQNPDSWVAEKVKTRAEEGILKYTDFRIRSMIVGGQCTRSGGGELRVWTPGSEGGGRGLNSWV